MCCAGSGAGKTEEDGLALLGQLAQKEWALETRLVQSYAYNDVIKAAVGDASLGGFLEAMRTKTATGTYLSLADPSLWPSLMSGMKACAFCEAQLWLVHKPPTAGALRSNHNLMLLERDFSD